VQNEVITAKSKLAETKPCPSLKLKQSNIQQVDRHEPLIIDESTFKEKLRAEIALNSISDAVICTDIDCNIDYLNIAAEKITGWTREEAYGLPITQVFNIRG
jgi:PAS domain-containing protein